MENITRNPIFLQWLLETHFYVRPNVCEQTRLRGKTHFYVRPNVCEQTRLRGKTHFYVRPNVCEQTRLRGIFSTFNTILSINIFFYEQHSKTH